MEHFKVSGKLMELEMGKSEEIVDELKEVEEIMKGNVGKLLKNGESVEEILLKSEHLEESSRNF